MTYYLTKAQKVLGQSAGAFADEFLDPIAAELDRALVFPKSLIGQLATMGFLGLTVPEQSPVDGAGFVGHIEVVQALSRSCAAIGSIVNNHALAAYAIAHWGGDAQKTQYLPPLVKGEKLGAVAIQEIGPTLGIGTDALLATRQGSDFVLNGTKAFVRNAGAADVYLVFGTIRPDADNTRLTCFIVDAGTNGLSVGPKLNTMGLKACPVAHLSFKDVLVTEASVMGSENNASGIASQILSAGAVAEGAQTVGIARAAVEHAAEYAKHRTSDRQTAGDPDVTGRDRRRQSSGLAWCPARRPADRRRRAVRARGGDGKAISRAIWFEDAG
jgi:alkylation response protein AidB-like acyl-CoA dehydrogenase